MKSRNLQIGHVSGSTEVKTSYPQSNDFLYAAGKAFATLLMGVATINCANAQTEKVYLQNQRSGMSVDLVMGNYGDAKEVAKKAEATASAATTKKETVIVKEGAVVNTPTGYIHGEDKYLKTKEDGKRYGEFQVYDINGKDKDQVVLGLLTNTLDRGVRFDEKGAVAQTVTMASTMIDKMDEEGKVIPGAGQVKLSAIRFADKIFVIVGENDYRYLDGKKIVGDTKLIDAMGKGKPITEVTFFYELQHAGYVKNMTAKQFGEMSLNQKERLLNASQVAGL